MSVAVGSGVWTWNAVQAVSANNMIVNVKILFIFSFFCCTRFCVIRLFAKCDEGLPVVLCFIFNSMSFFLSINQLLFSFLDQRRHALADSSGNHKGRSWLFLNS